MLSLSTRKKGRIFALNFIRKHFAIWCARTGIGSKSLIIGFFSVAFCAIADEVIFTGKLVRKYYDHLVPQAAERGVFGWFLELDDVSKTCLQAKISELSKEDQQCCARHAFDPTIVQLFLSGEKDRLLCSSLEGMQVEAIGDWPRSPHVFRPIPSYQLHLTHMKQIPAGVKELSGILISKVFPGPPNYDSIEDGDYPEVGWILKLNGGCMGMNEIEIETEKSFDRDLQLCIGRQVVCRGILRDAESAHHHTPFLLSACRLLAVPQSQFQQGK